MKVHLTKVTDIVGKDGKEWTKLDYIAPTGEVGTTLYPRGSQPSVEEDITPTDLAQFSTTNVEYNARGRIVQVGE